ncbi:Disease resistance protein RPM1 [Triticum urartu]|uniref:Disease resistance protein RPM1 n=3 Tax=Triticum urartu TaxID=4572 RepID=M7ZFR6_TRIUA|nr:Disease resistance protein RPM1 [Triticum urartu]
MGAMSSLLGKLGKVIKKEYKLQKGVKKKVKSFSDELDIMHAALGKVAEVPRDQLDEQIKLWAADVRELSYDMEDVVDSLLVRVEGSDPSADQSNFKKLMDKMLKVFKKGKSNREISTAVEEIHERLQDVAERHERYRHRLANLPAAKVTTTDPFWEVFYGDKKNIIGLEKARDDIIEKISDGDRVSKAHLKILSIVGFGGLGKTTLAREVYDALPTKFDYKAFVSVSRNPDMKKVLSNLLFKLHNRRHARLNAANLDVEQLIDLVRELLSKKRYFIIIDDLWDQEAWRTIRYALQDHECGSIIITTTRQVEVSKDCCSSKEDMIHQMKHLSDDDSQKLFYGRIFSSEVCRSGFEDVSAKILKKCAGVPLAIISLASYLANNQKNNQIDQWYVLLNSIGRGLEKGDDHVKEMKRILSLSFYALPSHLKTCFLYLSIFPEDHQISRDRLIRRWICEGFIQVKDETDSLLELGDSYFNELVNRNMIMPINIHADGRVEACCVHDIMLDLIFELASGENFVTILDVIKGSAPLEKKFRRLSLQKSMTDLTNAQMATTSMSQVRSFTSFSPAVSKIPPLTIFQLLRVLDLEGCDLRKSPGVDLRHVGKLLHLRYLGLRGTKVGKLPMEIGKLQFLQTLDLQWTNSKELPSSVAQLRHLMCLILDLGMPLPNGFSNLKCLEQLTGHGVGIFTEDSAKELGYLIGLRELAFHWNVQWRTGYLRTVKALFESLSNLHKLESLEISAIPWVVNLMLELDWVPFPNLRRLKLEGHFSSLPTWICSSSLPLLSYLDLTTSGEVQSGAIEILGMLPALRYVNFSVSMFRVQNTLENLVLSSGAFPNARVCLFHNILLLHPTIQPGAMPMVQRLRFGLGVYDMLRPDFDLSIRNLPSLKQLRIDLYDSGVKHDYYRAVDMLRRLADDHPKNPTLRADKFNG